MYFKSNHTLTDTNELKAKQTSQAEETQERYNYLENYIHEILKDYEKRLEELESQLKGLRY